MITKTTGISQTKINEKKKKKEKKVNHIRSNFMAAGNSNADLKMLIKNNTRKHTTT